MFLLPRLARYRPERHHKRPSRQLVQEDIAYTRLLQEGAGVVFTLRRELHVLCVIIRKYPIIGLASRLEGLQFVCSFVKRLHQRVTDGVYYDIVDNPDFSQAFGRSFERFVGDMLRRGYRRGDVLTEDEFISGKGSKRTVDWIVDDEDAALFVECKTKRMRLDGTIRMSPDSQEDDAAVLAKALCQAYKSLRDYQEGRYLGSRHTSYK